VRGRPRQANREGNPDLITGRARKPVQATVDLPRRSGPARDGISPVHRLQTPHRVRHCAVRLNPTPFRPNRWHGIAACHRFNIAPLATDWSRSRRALQGSLDRQTVRRRPRAIRDRPRPRQEHQTSAPLRNLILTNLLPSVLHATPPRLATTYAVQPLLSAAAIAKFRYEARHVSVLSCGPPSSRWAPLSTGPPSGRQVWTACGSPGPQVRSMSLSPDPAADHPGGRCSNGEATLAGGLVRKGACRVDDLEPQPLGDVITAGQVVRARCRRFVAEPLARPARRREMVSSARQLVYRGVRLVGCVQPISRMSFTVASSCRQQDRPYTDPVTVECAASSSTHEM